MVHDTRVPENVMHGCHAPRELDPGSFREPALFFSVSTRKPVFGGFGTCKGRSVSLGALV